MNWTWLPQLPLCWPAGFSVWTLILKIAEVFRKADAAHVKWQTDGSSYWACCDQNRLG